METKYVIVFLLPEILTKRILALRKNFQPNADPSLPPHITIIRPFNLGAEQQAALQEIARLEVVNSAVKYGGANTFMSGDQENVVYLGCEGKTLQTAQDAVCRVLPKLSPFQDETSTFHITVARNVLGESLDQLLTELTTSDFKGNFIPRQLSVYCKNSGDRGWRTLN